MKVGDMVKLKKSGNIGLVVDKVRRCVPDGNPNGDFNIMYSYRVACDDKFIMIRQQDFFKVAEVVNE